VLTAALVAFVVTLALEPVVIKQLTRRAILDVPVDRSNHTVPTPRGGGVAVIAGVLVATLVAWNSAAISLLGGILIAAAVGGLEDVRGIRIVPRLLLTTVAALALLAALTVDDLPDGVAGGLLIVVAVPWTLAVVNAVNFMDGINGISAVTAVIGGSAYALIGKISDVETLTILGLAVAGAGLGFAPYNVFRARVFLGDIGSYGLGAAFAAMSLLAVAKGLPPEAAAAPLGLYLADTGTTILRRARAGEQWHLPHKQHVYQRLVALGLPHVGVSAAVGAITAACSALGMVSLSGSVMARAAADLALLVLLGVYLACPRLLQGLLGRARSRQ
jgi:UDP-N-acetylmuramyl pentapeptide phosphotransferase/UDP-N-acetylglucosamine-1-phosphate transferase